MKKTDVSIAKQRRDIAEEERRLEQLHGGSHSRRLAELDDLRTAARAAKNTHEDHKKQKADLVSEKRQAEEAIKEHSSTRVSKEHTVRHAEQRLRTLRDRVDRKDVYPPGMDLLESAIKRDNGFQEQPVGPLGDFITLRKPVWSKVLEKSLGSTLTAFVVTSQEDQQRLSNIMRKVKCTVPIFIGNHSRFDFSGFEPDSKYGTILRILKVENPLILRQLIIHHNIEQIILIEDMDVARDTVMGSRLRNVKACYSLQPGNSGLGERFAYGADSSVSTSYMDVHQGLPRMRMDMGDQIRLEDESLARARRELDGHDQEQRELQRVLESKKKALNDHDRASKNLQVEYQRAEDEVEEMMQGLEADTVEEGRLEALKDQLHDCLETKTHLANSFEDSVNAKDEYLARRKRLLDDQNELDGRVAAANEKIMRAQSMLDKADEKRHEALIKKNEAVKNIDDLQNERTLRQEELDTQNQQITDFTRQASAIGARVPIDPGETTDSLDRKLQKLDADQAKFEERIGGNTEKISNDYAAAFQAHKAAAEQVADDEALIAVRIILVAFTSGPTYTSQLFKETYQHRKYRWEQFKKYITARARITFSHFLSERGFQGKLTINHKEKLLEINVSS